MFKTFFLKELSANVQNKRFLLVLILCVMMIPLTFYFNHKNYEIQRQNYLESQQRYDETHQSIQDLLVQGATTFRPPSPMSIISMGIGHLFPTAIETIGFLTQGNVKTQFVNDRRMDLQYSILYGFFDLSFIVTLVISALIILFTFDSIAGEKENRTLGQIFSNSVPRHSVILSKISANFLLLSMAFLIAILLGVLLLAFRGFEFFSNPVILFRFLSAIIISLLFTFVFFNFGVLISCLTKNSNIAIVILVFLWVVLFSIFPKLSVILSIIIKPVESQQVIDLKKNQLRTQIENETEAEIDRLASSFAGLNNQSITEFRRNLAGEDQNAKEYEEKQSAIREAYQSRLETELAKIDAHHQRQIFRQIRLAKNVSRLSPFSCFIHLLAEISDTGLLEHQAWLKTRSRFEQLLNDEISSKIKRTRFKNFSTSSIDFERQAPAPKLEYQLIRFEAILSHIWIDLVLLVFYGILFFATAYVTFIRYDIR